MTSPRPNIVVIITDDQAPGTWGYWPFLQSVKAQGREYRWLYSAISQCAPSRAAFLSGRYPRNNHVVNNAYPNGGYFKFVEEGLESQTWAKLLQDSGYDTLMAGKYFNQYETGNLSVPPGWSRWWALYNDQNKKYFNYTANNNGVSQSYGSGDTNYVTNQIRDRALESIADNTAVGKPFALFLSPPCPHTPSVPAIQYAGTHANTPFDPEEKANFNTTTPSKLPYVSSLVPMNETDIAKAALYYRRGLECMASIDDMFQAVWNAVAQAGQLNNTYFFIGSDNGFLWGEWMVSFTKGYQHREAMRGNLYVWGPGVVPGADTKNIVTLADLHPTILELAGLPIPEIVDARSIVPTFPTQNLPWRQQFLIQGPGGNLNPIPGVNGLDFFALVTRDYQFTHHTNPPINNEPVDEMYDHGDDPRQLTNIAPNMSPAFIAEVTQRIFDLHACSGAACRVMEDQAPPAL